MKGEVRAMKVIEGNWGASNRTSEQKCCCILMPQGERADAASRGRQRARAGGGGKRKAKKNRVKGCHKLNASSRSTEQEKMCGKLNMGNTIRCYLFVTKTAGEMYTILISMANVPLLCEFNGEWVEVVYSM